MLKRSTQLNEVSDGRITLHIVLPRFGVQSVLAPGSSRISVLNRQFPQANMTYIHDGQILSSEHTFDFYNIKEGDSIVAVPSDSNPVAAHQWISLTRDTEVLSNAIREATSPDLRPEVRRLADLRALRLDTHPKHMIRAARWFEQARIRTSSSEGSTIIAHSGDTPNIEPLPVLW
jgi:hypothetical protein